MTGNAISDITDKEAEEKTMSVLPVAETGNGVRYFGRWTAHKHLKHRLRVLEPSIPGVSLKLPACQPHWTL